MTPPPHQTMLDSRGFIFTLPHLGLPDPRICEPVLIKAAIGPKAAALDLLFDNPTLQTPPLRREGTLAFAETGMVDIECRGSLWALPLLKPNSSSRDAPPEIFSIKVKRLAPSFMPDTSRSKLPDNSDWVFFPMAAYEGQLAARSSSAAQTQQRRYFAIDAGTAAQAQAKAKAQHKEQSQQKQVREDEEDEAEQLAKIMQATTLTSDMYDPTWLHALKLSTMLEEANNGNPSAAVHDTQRLKLRLRVHPAEDNEYESIDYMVRRQDEDEATPVAEGRWKRLPAEATKGGNVQRLYVNMHRARKGKRALSREEWTSTRSV